MSLALSYGPYVSFADNFKVSKKKKKEEKFYTLDSKDV